VCDDIILLQRILLETQETREPDDPLRIRADITPFSMPLGLDTTGTKTERAPLCDEKQMFARGARAVTERGRYNERSCQRSAFLFLF